MSFWVVGDNTADSNDDDDVKRYATCFKAGQCRREKMPFTISYIGRHVYFRIVLLSFSYCCENEIKRDKVILLFHIYSRGRQLHRMLEESLMKE
jgi:hypothetical protein